MQREHTKEENDQIKIYREHSIREEHQDQYRVYIDRGVKCEQQQLWTQQDGAADQQIILQGNYYFLYKKVLADAPLVSTGRCI